MKKIATLATHDGVLLIRSMVYVVFTGWRTLPTFFTIPRW